MPSKFFDASIGLYWSLIGIPANVTVDVVEAARWMGVLSLTGGLGLDLDRGLCDIVNDKLSIADFPEGKVRYHITIDQIVSELR